LNYGDLQHSDRVLDRLVAAGISLRDEAAAQAIVFAGAGLARYVAPLEDATGLVVIDPTQAAAAILLAQVMQRTVRPTR
jgi:Asp/Glu/hydantoin racemase